MPPITLHHYPASPFAEKMRAILGFKGLTWQSVRQPATMPKPDLLALTGGYRRVPVLQIGNDVVCDTALMCDVLEHLQPAPTLYPAGLKGVARTVSQWADSTLFNAAIAYGFGPAGRAEIMAKYTPEQAATFVADRKAMRGPAFSTQSADVAAPFKSYLRRINTMLDGQPYLLGAQPSVADFSVYHPLWFARRVESVASVFEPTPAVLSWMDRMAAFGHGTIERCTATESIAACAAFTATNHLFDVKHEVFQDEHGIPLGSLVNISAESFGTEVTQGTLVAATRTRYTLRRVDERAGTVQVHFPRIGYVLQAATSV
jgi:glutathione S-transferase